MRRLYRSTRDKKLFGLCGGLAESLGIDATLLRIVAIVLAVFTSGGFMLVYILAALVVPKEPPMYGGPGPYGRGPGPGAGPDGYWGYPPGGSWKPHGPGAAPGPGPTSTPGHYSGHTPPGPQSAPPAPGNIDAMMDDLEKKALRREIEELRMKIKQMEKGE